MTEGRQKSLLNKDVVLCLSNCQGFSTNITCSGRPHGPLPPPWGRRFCTMYPHQSTWFYSRLGTHYGTCPFMYLHPLFKSTENETQLVRFFVPQQLALCLGENRHSTVKWLTWMNEQLMPQKWKDRTIHLFFTCRPGSRSVFHLGDREQLLQHSLLTELAASLKTGYCFGRPDPDAPALSALHVLILLTMFLNKEKRTQEYFLLILQMFINSSQTLKKGLFSWLYVTALLAKTSKHGMQMKPFTTVCM